MSRDKPEDKLDNTMRGAEDNMTDTEVWRKYGHNRPPGGLEDRILSEENKDLNKRIDALVRKSEKKQFRDMRNISREGAILRIELRRLKRE